MKLILILVSAVLVSAQSYAQDYGVIAGIHSSNAKSDSAGVSNDAELGFNVGLAIGMELVPNIKLRTGVEYTTLPFKLTDSLGVETKTKFAYIQVPVLFQYNFNPMVGLFAGPVIDFNVGKKVDIGGTTASVTDMKSIYLLGELGANFAFDQIGFDVYYQMGFGDITDNAAAKDYSIIGANFLYWF